MPAESLTIQLAEGGRAVFSQVSTPLSGGGARIELQLQLLDAQGHAAPAVVVDTTQDNALSKGSFASLSAVPLAGGGFAIGYDRVVWNQGVGTAATSVVTFAASGAELGRLFPSDPGFPGSKVPLEGQPRLMALSEGGFAVVAHGDATFVGADGAQLGHLEFGSVFSLFEAAQGSVVLIAREVSAIVDPGGSPNPRTLRLVVEQDGSVLDSRALVVADGSTSGADTIAGGEWSGFLSGGYGDDALSASIGDDVLAGGAGADTLTGGQGDDVLLSGDGRGFLRGEEGDDFLLGGDEFDDMHGNMGADTVRGGGGEDWVVGGKDNDLLYGEDGFDIVYGNLGDDTCSGGAGADWVRGGQGDDRLFGGDGADLMWGDRGSDTLSGGAGGDEFHIFAGAGLDRITDFSVQDGDRVVVEGATYSVSVVGEDTVIDLGGGDQLVLAGVQLAAGGWLVAG
jgi:Ca2+-binding RTX toxin-like protein